MREHVRKNGRMCRDVYKRQDYDRYGVERDFYIDYKAEMPGVISEDPEKLAAAVASDDYDLRLSLIHI